MPAVSEWRGSDALAEAVFWWLLKAGKHITHSEASVSVSAVSGIWHYS